MIGRRSSKRHRGVSILVYIIWHLAVRMAGRLSGSDGQLLILPRATRSCRSATLTLVVLIGMLNSGCAMSVSQQLSRPQSPSVTAICEPAKQIGAVAAVYVEVEVTNASRASFLAFAVTKTGAQYSPLKPDEASEAAGGADKLVAGLPHIRSLAATLAEGAAAGAYGGAIIATAFPPALLLCALLAGAVVVSGLLNPRSFQLQMAWFDSTEEIHGSMDGYLFFQARTYKQIEFAASRKEGNLRTGD
jgi:hypothetical protein